MPKLTLKVTHTHAGAVYRAGDVIEVDEVTASWLVEHGVGQLTAAPASQVAATEAAALPETRSQRKAKE